VIRLGVEFLPDGSVVQHHIGPVPKRSTFRAGDRVQLHGYVGSYPGLEQVGFRGFVLGGFGAGLLRGLTDDGMEWVIPAGWLVRDGERESGGAWCVCCPHPERFRARKARRAAEPRTFGPVPECLRPYLPVVVETVQLGLFEVAA